MTTKFVTRASVSIKSFFGDCHKKNTNKNAKKVEITKKPFTNNITGIEGCVMALEQLGVIK